MMQEISYYPTLPKFGGGQEAPSPSNTVSLKRFAAFRRLRRLSIDMGPPFPWSLLLDPALEGGDLYLPAPHCVKVRLVQASLLMMTMC